MAIDLGQGRSTMPPAADWRLRRIVQVAADLLGKPLSQARVLDLACLEGHYGIEFAMQGADRRRDRSSRIEHRQGPLRAATTRPQEHRIHPR